MNSEKSILRFMKVYNINSPEGLQNKRSEDATLSVGLILTGMKDKSANEIKKELTGKDFAELVDNVKGVVEYIDQNPDATDDEKKNAVSNIVTVNDGEISIKNLHDCETCTNLYFEDGTQVQESDTTGKNYKVTVTTTAITGHKGVEKVKD